MKDDNDIITGILKKDQTAFIWFVDKYGGLIKTIVYHYINYSREEAEECVNDILVSIWQNTDRYDCSKNSFKNWIGAVSKYKCMDMLRKKYSDMKTEPIEEGLCNSFEGFENDILLKELIEELLKNLNKSDSELFFRRYVLGEDISYIAVKAGKTKEYIYDRLSKNRKKLRKRFEGGEYFEK